MSQREQIKAVAGEGIDNYRQAFNEEAASQKAILSSHSSLRDTTEALDKALSALQEAKIDLQQARESNGKAARNWSEAFQKLIVAGAAESGRDGVVHALKDANNHSEVLETRHPMLQAHIEKIAPFIGALQGMIQYLNEEISPDLAAANDLSREFVGSQVQIEGEWQAGRGRVHLNELRDWEGSI